VKNGEVPHGVKEEKNILHTVKQRKANLIGHRLRLNCFVRQVIEGKMEEEKRRGRRCKPILDGLSEESSSWYLKEKALDCAVWRTRFGRGYGPVARQTRE
jgi:hypothetical protein